MKKILLLLFILVSIQAKNQFDISLEYKNNYSFEDYILRSHIYKQTAEANSSDLVGITAINTKNTGNFSLLNLNANFNDMIGINYSQNNIKQPAKFQNIELYFGTNVMKFFSYKKIKQDIIYNTNFQYDYKLKDADNTDTIKIHNSDTSKDTTQLTFFNILIYSKSHFNESSKETINNTTSITHTKYDLEITSLTSENFYDTVKNDALIGNDYIYPIAIAKNFTISKNNFRIYGLALLSYEHYDYSKVSGYKDSNSTTSIYIKSDADGKANDIMLKADEKEISGKFKGFGYGYKLTAEVYWDNFSMFITSYMKKLSLKNYHSGISKRESNSAKPNNIVGNDTITFSNRYTTFGIKYRF